MNEKVGISPFLETVTRSSAPEPDKPARPGSNISLKILKMIPVNGSAPVARLLEQSDMSFKDFANAIEAIQGAGLIELDGTGSQATARLTDIGAKLASLV